MIPGQQFSDWSSIDNSQPGILGGLAAYGVQKSGLQDFLNTKLPDSMKMVGGKMTYGAVPPPTTSAAMPANMGPVPPTMGVAPTPGPEAPTLTPANEQQPAISDGYHPDAAKALNLSAWDGPEFGSGGQDKMNMLASFLG